MPRSSRNHNTVPMKKNLLLLVFIQLLLLLSPVFAVAQQPPVGTPDSVGMSSERLDRLHQTMQRYVNDEKVAGIVTLVLRNGEVADFSSYGELSREENLPMRKDAIFRIASQSKAVTSTAIMMLFEEGKLLLSDPVSQYIPDFANPTVAIQLEDRSGYRLEQAQRGITIRDLLTHTAGISYGAGATDLYR